MFVSTENWPYLGSGERYGRGCNQSLIESAVCSVRWDGNHWF